MTRSRLACSFVLIAGGAALVACATEKSANPLSPSVAGPIPGVAITAPQLVTPSPGTKVKDTDQPISLTIGNSSTTGVRPLSYHFELASDSAFHTVLVGRDAVQPGKGGKTTLRLPEALATGHTYYWHARAEDGANMSSYPGAVSFSVYTPVVLSVPVLVSPVGSAAVTTLAPTLVFTDAARTGPAGQITYNVQYSTSAAFAPATTRNKAEESGQTSLGISGLTAQQTYYWRARATDPSSGTTGAWSAAATFVTPVDSTSGSGGGGGGTSGGGGNSGTCDSSSPEAIVGCERAKFGHMSDSQLVTFLMNVADSLNRNNIGGGPFGALRKTGGSNCDGFSCDVICAGQGLGQRQWDVLGDAEGSQTPGWNGPATVPNIRVDACVIP